MSRITALALLEFRQIWRAGTVIYGAGVVLLVAVAALVSGVRRVETERAVLAGREPFLQEQAVSLTHKHANDFGLLTYYLAMPTEHAPTDYTALATGLRDVHPFSQHLRLLGLVPQAYASELGSPLQQLTGSLDFAFVVTFLLPLLVIALGYDVASRDRALGTDLLLAAQPMHRSRVVALRLGVRALTVAITTVALAVLALLLARLPLDGRLLWLLSLSLAYVVFWTLVVWLVASLDRSSGWNAVALMGAWVGCCVLLPAAANTALMSAPTESVVALTLTQRELMNAGWDKPKSVTMAPFWERRPEWRATPIPEDQFSWPWYYAMHEVADIAVASEVASYRRTMDERERRTHWAAMLLPPLVVQRALSRMAATDLSAHLAYQESVADYHETLKSFFYPLLFGGKGTADFVPAQVPRHRFQLEPSRPELGELTALFALIAVLLAVGVRRRGRLDRA